MEARNKKPLTFTVEEDSIKKFASNVLSERVSSTPFLGGAL